MPVRLPFWLEPDSRFCSSIVTMFAEILFLLTLPLSLAPSPPAAGSFGLTLADRTCGYHEKELRHIK